MVWRHRSALCQFHSWTSFSLTPPHVLTKWHQRRHHCSCQVWSIFLAGLQWWRENALKKKHKRETIKVHMFWQYCLPWRCFCVFFFLRVWTKKAVKNDHAVLSALCLKNVLEEYTRAHCWALSSGAVCEHEAHFKHAGDGEECTHGDLRE